MTEEQFTDEQGNIVTKKVSAEPLSWGAAGETEVLRKAEGLNLPLLLCCYPYRVGQLQTTMSVIQGNSGELETFGSPAVGTLRVS